MLIHTVKVSAVVAAIECGCSGYGCARSAGATDIAREPASRRTGLSRKRPDRSPSRNELNSVPRWYNTLTRPAGFKKNSSRPSPPSFRKEQLFDQLLKHIKRSTTDDTFSGIPIYVDPAGLLEAHQTISMPVVINVSKRPAGLILSDALRGSGLSYCVSDGFLMISSRSAIVERRVDQIEHKLDLVLDALRRIETAK